MGTLILALAPAQDINWPGAFAIAAGAFAGAWVFVTLIKHG